MIESFFALLGKVRRGEFYVSNTDITFQFEFCAAETFTTKLNIFNTKAGSVTQLNGIGND